MKKNKSKKKVIVAVIAVILALIVGGAVIYFLKQMGGDSDVSFSDKIIAWFSQRIQNKGLLAFIISMIPIVELRLALPVCLEPTFSLSNWLTIFGLSVLGNILPVPFILLLIKKVFAWMKTWGSFFEKLVTKLESRAEKKSGEVKSAEVVGLALFVGVPLPGTGAWTGALIAALLNISFGRALFSIIAGVLIAGFIVSAIFYGLAYLSGVLSLPVFIAVLAAAVAAYIAIWYFNKKRKAKKEQAE